MHTYSIVACARWEAPYIAEWIRYNEAIGFDHIYLYCNDDDPAELRAAVAATPMPPGFVTFVHFPGQGQQVAMYRAAMQVARGASDWVMFLDIDEFVALRSAATIQAFMAARTGVDSVHFNWLFYGHNGFVERPPGSVLRQYVERAPALSINMKHLTRTAALTDERLSSADFPFWHGLPDPVWAGLCRVNVLGDDMAPLLTRFHDTASAYLAAPGQSDRMIAEACIHHYALKSEADFMLRARRGTGGEFAAQRIYQAQYENGSYRAALDEMRGTTDPFLRDFSLARISEPEMPNSVKTQPERIRVIHRLWSDELILLDPTRLQHAGHGTLASYYRDGAVLHVKWDDYPADVFLDRGDAYVHAAASSSTIINMRGALTADLDPVFWPVSGIMLQVPNSDHRVEVRPGSSDVDVFRAVFLGQEYARPELPWNVRTIVDLGANVGLASVFYGLRYPEAVIVAVEPEAGNFSMLLRNVIGLPNVVAVQAAIWPTDTHVKLRRTDSTGHSLGDWGVQTIGTVAPEPMDVPAVSIPTLMKQHGLRSIDLLKVDIEGAELDLMRGQVDLWLPHVRCIVIETHERFRAGSDAIVTASLATGFVEQAPNGENRIFVRP